MKRILTSFAVILVLFLWAFLFVTSNQIAGVHSFIVNSGSMEPAIPTGALVITRIIDPTQLRTGDVITYRQSVNNQKQFITHRIAHITSRDTNIMLKTKGDSNWRLDTWNVSGNAIIGKVAFTFPNAGSFLLFARSITGMTLFVVIPAMLILATQIKTIFTRATYS